MLSFALLTLLHLVAAQSNTPIEIAGIQAHFNQSGLVPSLIPKFEPSALLTVNFGETGDLHPGQAISQAQSGTTPTISLTPANSSVKLDGNFTAILVDANIVGTAENSVNRHWLLNNANIIDNKLSNSSAIVMTSYKGPGPPSGSGPHRYVFLLFLQSSDFKAPAEPDEVSPMNLQEYIGEAKLGQVFAANYMIVEVGSATVTPSSTAPVVSSTLTAANPTGSGRSGSGSGSGSGTPTPSNAASQLTVGGALFAFLSSILILA